MMNWFSSIAKKKSSRTKRKTPAKKKVSSKRKTSKNVTVVKGRTVPVSKNPNGSGYLYRTRSKTTGKLLVRKVSAKQVRRVRV